MARYSSTRRIAGLAAAALSSAVWAQGNDSCSNATPLALGGSVNGFTNPLTTNTDGSSSCGGSRDVWHSVVVPCGGELTVYTCPASYDTVISVHTGCPGTTGNQISCNDDSPYCGASFPTASAITVPVSPGTYIIRVSGFSGATGSYTLNAFVTPAPPGNDTCASAPPIGNGAFNGCTSGASVDGSADCGSSNLSPDVWYSYAAPCDGVLDLYTCPASFDTVISVHSACPGTTSNEIACNDDSLFCGAAYPRASYLPLPVVGGNRYLIRVSGFNGASGSFTLNAHLNAGAPANDSCASATAIADGAFAGSTACATLDGSSDCSFSNGPDVWYRYTPACSGTLALYTCPASYDTVISVHTGCPGTANNQIACNDDSAYCGAAYPFASYLPLPVVAGTPYLIRVSGFNGLSGTFVLNTAITCCYANCDGSTVPPVLNVNDFVCFQSRFAGGNAYADCNLSGTLNVDDFVCFQSRFAAGCP